MPCVARCSLPQHAVNKNLWACRGDIFIAKITCHLRITSGLYWLRRSISDGAISQLRRAKWKPAPDVIGPRRYFHLAQPSAERDDSRRCFFVGAARPSDRINWKQKRDKRGADR